MSHLKNIYDQHTKCRVGIFMPCYNMGQYLEDSLGTLDKQTFKDFFVIIADDASSSEETKSILKKINKPSYTIYFEKKNLGLIKISNKYMSMLNADYVMLFSPDDLLHPDFLKEHVDYLDSNPGVHAVSSWIQEFGDNNNIIKYYDKLCKLPHMLIENHFSGAALMRKTAWETAGKYDTARVFYPNLDYELWLSMLEKGFKLGTIHKPLFYWRVVGDSLSHRMSPKELLAFRVALLKKYANLYKDHSLFVTERNLKKLSDFEEYYLESEKGHAWLDKQYKNLTKQNSELINVERHLTEKTSDLEVRLRDSVYAPGLKKIYRIIKRKSRR